jgi:hypothetical protein
MASSSSGVVGLGWGVGGATFPGGQGPGPLHEGSIEQAPSASMVVKEPPPLDGGKIWRVQYRGWVVSPGAHHVTLRFLKRLRTPNVTQLFEKVAHFVW